MPGTEPKLHHIVQRAFLEGFIDPELARRGQRRVWVYLVGRQPLAQNPETVAVRKHFYCFERDGEHQFSVELGLQKLEDLAFPILEKLRSRDFQITADERFTFAGYIALAHSRVPAAHRELDRKTSLAKAKQLARAVENDAIMARVASNHEKETGERLDVSVFRGRFRAGTVEVSQPSREYTLKQMYENTLALQVIFDQMNWTFLIAPQDDPGFLTSDDPVAVFDPESGEFGALSFAEDRATHLVFPICRDVCLLAEREKGVKVLALNSAGVRSVNTAVLERFDSQVYAPFSSPHVQSIVESVANARAPRKSTVTIRNGVVDDGS